MSICPSCKYPYLDNEAAAHPGPCQWPRYLSLPTCFLGCQQEFTDDQIHVERYLNLRYEGTDVPVMTPCPVGDDADPAKAFEEQYKREFGFTLSVSTLSLIWTGVAANNIESMHAKAQIGCLPTQKAA